MDEIDVDEIAVDEIAVDEIAVDETTVNEIIVNETGVNNVDVDVNATNEPPAKAMAEKAKKLIKLEVNGHEMVVSDLFDMDKETFELLSLDDIAKFYIDDSQETFDDCSDHIDDVMVNSNTEEVSTDEDDVFENTQCIKRSSQTYRLRISTKRSSSRK